MGENVLWMNQAEAKRLKIADGDMVGVTIQDRKGSVRVRVTEFIHRRRCSWYGSGRTLPVESRAQGPGLAVNRFMPGGLTVTDPAGGGPALQEHLVMVKKLEIPPRSPFAKGGGNWAAYFEMRCIFFLPPS